MKLIMIASATTKNLTNTLNLYECVKTFMVPNSNLAQWADSYPQKELLLWDIKQNRLFLCNEARGVYDVPAFVIGEDTTYAHIENSSWLSNAPYDTIYQIAGNGTKKDVFVEAVFHCECKSPHLCIDTSHSNHIIQHLIMKYSFQKCGTIYVTDDSSRIAYGKICL